MTRLLVTMGDPAGIGPEVLLRALSRWRNRAAQLSIVGDLQWLKQRAGRHRISVPWARFRWVDLGDLCSGVRPGKVQAGAGRAAYACLEEAVRILRRGEAEGLVTAPVSKEAIVRAGISWRGHTEHLGKRFRCRPVMMLTTGRLRVALVTTHLALRDVPRALTRAAVAQVIRMTHRALAAEFGIRRPRLALAALNPHCGEGGLFGEEEKRILLPALRSADGEVAGPLPADSVMAAAARGRFDAVVALYHDQALIPIKMLGWDQAVNVTLGLPFVRTSPVHGTAFDLAARGEADPRSMEAALHLAVRLVRKRREAARRKGGQLSS